MEIETTVRVWREGRHFIAHALPIDVSSAGDSPLAARQALREAVEVFVNTARDQGTLEDALEECGYQRDGSRWVAPSIIEEQRELLAV